MMLARRWEELAASGRPLVLAVGSFDGVHRGHQAVIREAVGRAAAWSAEAWVMTFDPHPLKVLRPGEAPLLLTSTGHKVNYIREWGVQGVLLLPFTKDLAAREPLEFLDDVKTALPGLKELVVGSNWTFGRRARGDVALLAEWAGGAGVAVTTVPPVEWEGQPVSSTRVRKAVLEGRLAEAESLLGRPFSILGTVVKGKQLGAKLGFPTANVDPHNEARPPPGVYEVRAATAAGRWVGAAFLAEPPPAGSGAFEAHLLDFQGHLYGSDLEVAFVRRLRGVLRFDSLEALREQIARDVADIRAGTAAGSRGPVFPG